MAVGLVLEERSFVIVHDEMVAVPEAQQVQLVLHFYAGVPGDEGGLPLGTLGRICQCYVYLLYLILQIRLIGVALA